MILGFLYALFYMSRYNNAAAMPQVMDFFGWIKSDMGVFESVLPIIYGVSVLVNGPLGDKIGGKKLFLIGATGVVLANLAMGACTLLVSTPATISGAGTPGRAVVEQATLLYGLSHDSLRALMAVVWAVNGYFQSMGAIAIVKVNFRWFRKLERGKFTGIFGILIRFGLVLGFVGVPLIAQSSLPLYCVWVIPALGVGLFGVLARFLVENSPQDAGYPGFKTGDEEAVDERPPSMKEVLFRILAQPMTWFVLVASIMIGMVRRGTIDVWFRSYFAEVYGGQEAPYQVAAWGIALLGILGGFTLGMASDSIFKGRRAPVICIGFTGMALMLAIGGLLHSVQSSAYLAAISLACLSFFVNGSHGIIGGAVTMDLGGRKATATATGLFDGAQYLVAGPVTGVVLGGLLETEGFGWTWWQWGLIPFAILGALAMAILWWKDKSVGRGGGGH